MWVELVVPHQRLVLVRFATSGLAMALALLARPVANLTDLSPGAPPYVSAAVAMAVLRVAGQLVQTQSRLDFDPRFLQKNDRPHTQAINQ